MAPRGEWKLLLLSALFSNLSFATGQNQNKTDSQKRIPITIPTPKGGSAWISPEYTWFFEHPLPLHTIKSPKYTYYSQDSKKSAIDYFEVEVKPFEKQIYPNLSPTHMVGYDGESPGPMFVMQQGREAVVRFTNNGTSDMSVHVHGQYNRAPFDGWAGDTAKPGQFKDYYYPNSQNARTIWYHDHSEYTTGENAYHGQEGSYIITDPEEQRLGLPKDAYDVAMGLSAKLYTSNGSLSFDTNNSSGLWGDIIQVNGQPWPYLKVEPRKYRFRWLNGAVSRTFNLYFSSDDQIATDSTGRQFNYSSQDDTTKAIKFDVIGSDGGLLSHPVHTDSLSISMGERYEAIVDFGNYAGKNITLRNERGMGENVDYPATDMIMRFMVGDSVTNNTNNGPIPSQLRNIPPPPHQDAPDKDFTFERVDDKWVINGVGFNDIRNRILTRPKKGDTEVWTLTNGAGEGTHPVHIHLVDFQILSRTGGRNVVYDYESAGLKDVVWLAGGETIKVIARYAPWAGVYMFHCHNLVHEDHDMLVAFNVSQLSKWGYGNDTQFIDPMTPEFRPKDYNAALYTKEAIMSKIKWFWNTNAYNHGNVGAVYSALDGHSKDIYDIPAITEASSAMFSTTSTTFQTIATRVPVSS